VKKAEPADYIVVGGGSAGMPVAARLSQRGHKVILLEAGSANLGPLYSWITHMPSAYGYAYRNPRTTWLYYGEPEPALNKRKMYQPRGKVIGGSSAVNGMGFLRAHPRLFDKWVAAGAQGWSFDDVLPYYKRLETWQGPANSMRGDGGPIRVRKGDRKCSYYDTFFEGGKELGFSFSEDINGDQNEGFADFQLNVDDGVRSSTDYAYTRYVSDPKNLCVIGHATATRILLEGEKAVGIEYFQNGEIKSVYASREVIISCGAFNSPQLLMLSGIGPEEELGKHHIKVRVKLEGVGQNLQDHPIIYPKYESTLHDSPIKHNVWYRKMLVGAQWLTTHKGPGTSNQMEAVALLRSGLKSDYPDIEFQFCPLVLDHDAGSASNIDGWSNSCGPVEVEARGWVKLSSANPFTPPRILNNFMSTGHDVDLMVKAFELNRALMETPSFRRITKRVLSKGATARSRSDIIQFLRAEVSGDYHPVGTCKIGSASDASAVVDHQLLVHGLQNLRIADASVMPVITNANTNATSIMIGERAADFITCKNMIVPASQLVTSAQHKI
jgi:choline dehydrogenase